MSKLAEVAHEHIDHGERSSGMGFLIGILLLVVLAIVLIYWGLPLIQRSQPAVPPVNVPGQIDVNINRPAQ